MTPLEEAVVRNLVARMRELDRQNRYLRQHRDKARTERNQARADAQWLHGLLIARGINPLRKVG